MPIALVAGLFWGGHPGALPGPVRDVVVDDETAIFAEAIDRVEGSYYREVQGEDLADAAIKGMVDSLDDRFSAYFTPKQYGEFQRAQRSEFSGVGLTVAEDPDGLRVVQVFDDSPANDAGLRKGDVILKVDDTVLKGLDQRKATDKIKGPPGSDVELTWADAQGGDRTTKIVVRATVRSPMVASELREAGGTKVGLVALSQFGPGAHGQVTQALGKLEQQGAKAYVLDLRRNGGGLVSEAQLVASAFLEDGKVVTTRGRSVKEQTLSATGDPVVPKKPLVVLVDRDTASAAEIVTGALQDDGRAEVIGTRTFGKGVFQQVIELSNGGALDITAGQYFTPKGTNLGGKGVSTGAGITPDRMAKDDPDTTKDEALRVALDAVAAKAG